MKRKSEGEESASDHEDQKEAKKKLVRGIPYTISIAVCSSMIDNAQSMELATMMAGQVARCASIFCVDEIVVIDDYKQQSADHISSCAAFLARILQYMETPQYLRRSLISTHPHLKHVGLLPPLNAPHHPRATEWTKYREGVVISVTDGISKVNVGLEKPVQIHKELTVNERITVRMKDKDFNDSSDAAFLRGKLVSHTEPRQRKGTFWGYSVRIASGIGEALTGCPYEGGYDLKIGTSEHGEIFDVHRSELPSFNHLLILFGAVDGLESATNNDANVTEKDPRPHLDMYLNTCPGQGTRTIRAEEAMLISMAMLATKFPYFFPV